MNDLGNREEKGAYVMKELQESVHRLSKKYDVCIDVRTRLRFRKSKLEV